MKNFRQRLMIFLFICTALFTSSSSATNFYERHGNNFIYLESQHDTISPVQYDTLTYAPVIWDIGGAFIELHNYYGSYGWESLEGCDSSYKAIDLLMEEAWDPGDESENDGVPPSPLDYISAHQSEFHFNGNSMETEFYSEPPESIVASHTPMDLEHDEFEDILYPTMESMNR